MNATAVPSKRSSLERRLDGLIGIIFCILAALCIVGAVGSVICLNTVSVPATITCALLRRDRMGCDPHTD